MKGYPPSRREWFALLLGASLGLVVALAVAASGAIEVEPTLSFTALIQALVTLTVALVVASLVQQNADRSRKEKELLFSLCESAMTGTDKLETGVESGVLTEVNKALKRLSVANTELGNLLIHLGVPDCDAASVGAAGLIRQLRALTTYTPRLALDGTSEGSAMDITVSDDRVVYSDARRERIEAKCSQLRLRFVLVQLAVNRWQ